MKLTSTLGALALGALLIIAAGSNSASAATSRYHPPQHQHAVSHD